MELMLPVELALAPVNDVDEKRDSQDQQNDTMELIFFVVADRESVPTCDEKQSIEVQ